MRRDEAIELAIRATCKGGLRPTEMHEVSAFHEAAGSRGVARSRWVVGLPLNVPDGFEPDRFFVEVYEDTAEIVVPPIL
jgi:hypothetical protein